VLFANDALDRVDRVVVGAVPGGRALGTGAPGQLRIVDSQSVVDVAAVAAGGLGRNLAGFQHHDAGAAAHQRAGGRQAGEAAAHDRHVHPSWQRIGAALERRSCICPE